MMKLTLKEGIESNIIDELNNLEYFSGYSKIPSPKYDYIDSYSEILKELPNETIIGMDWSGGNCYFKKKSDNYIGWEILISPHYNLEKSSTDKVSEWFCARGAWCKKPLWLATAEEFNNIVNKEKGSSSSTGSFWGSSDKKNYGQKKGFYGI